MFTCSGCCHLLHCFWLVVSRLFSSLTTLLLCKQTIYKKKNNFIAACSFFFVSWVDRAVHLVYRHVYKYVVFHGHFIYECTTCICKCFTFCSQMVHNFSETQTTKNSEGMLNISGKFVVAWCSAHVNICIILVHAFLHCAAIVACLTGILTDSCDIYTSIYVWVPFKL